MKYNTIIRKIQALILSLVLILTLPAGYRQNVKAADEMGGYLWAFFNASGGYEKIFFGYSKDGLTWQKLNKDAGGTPQPIMVNDALGSDLGVRDPHIIKAHDGSKYWLLGTDLHAEGGGAGGSGWNQYSASKNIVVWESSDLVNWSAPKLVFAGLGTAGCVWAPEAIYDNANDEYVVYWSARDYSLRNTDKDALRVYVSRTKDFNSFTTPKIWLSEDENSGGEVNIIDTTIAYDGEYYYRFSTSDWNTVIDRSRTLDTDDVFDVTVNRTKSMPNGSWERIVTRSGSGAAGFDGREGLTVYQLPDGKWCAMGDHSGYAAFVTDNMGGGKFTRTNANFIDGAFRHGTVIRLTKAEEKQLLDAFGAGIDDGSGTLDEEVSDEPVLCYDFEGDLGSKTIKDVSTGNDKSDDGILYGNAAISYDSSRKSNILTLDGSNGSYAAFPLGFFDYRDTMTISMDVKSELSSGNFFTFTYGRNNTAYNFLRIRGSEVRNAITTNSWQNEQEVKGTGPANGTWMNVAIVVDKGLMKLYINGKMVSENENTGINTSYLGKGLYGYIGKSLYDGDAYFKGSFDNIKIYNRVLSDEEVLAGLGDNVQILNGAVVGTVPTREEALNYRGTDYHSSVYTAVNYSRKVIIPYVKTGTDIKSIPVKFDVITDDVTIKVDGKDFINGSKVNLESGAKVMLTFGNKTEEYVIAAPIMSCNSVLPGQYADPDIDYFDGKFWIFPTTDGYPGWSGTLFHAWSSEDMINWEDEGVIMELANSNPGKNEKGVQIASSGWAVGGSAWAPTIEEKNGKYYFYYCGKDSGGTSQIGVAYADNPAGPYTDIGSPLITVSECRSHGVNMGQAIDPSIFTDDDGTSYVTFGNGSAAIVTLNDDMISIDKSSYRQINGLSDFRESVVVLKKDGRYHWTWTCDDANSPNYHVNYGVSDSLYGNISVIHRPLLAKNENLGILGTGHQSMLAVKDKYGNDRYFIAYHRFYSPVNIFTSSDGLGVHRETCIDEVTFDENGYMNVINPSHEGVTAFAKETLPDATPTPGTDATPTPSTDATPTPGTDATPTPGTDATPTPGTDATPTPGIGATPTPGTAATPAPSDDVKVKAPVIKLKGKSKVKRGKKIVIRAKITNKNGSKAGWSLDKKGKKLFKLKNKKKDRVTVIAKKKKGKGTLIFKYGKKKYKKKIKVY